MKEKNHYRMAYRQRVYQHPVFPHQKIQVLGDGEPQQHWLIGGKVEESQKVEDSWIQVDRMVSPYDPCKKGK